MSTVNAKSNYFIAILYYDKEEKRDEELYVPLN